MADLITLEQFKLALGIPDNSRDARIAQIIKGASAAVRSYTGRTFELATGTVTTRSFEYDGTGIVDIDDAVSVASVTIASGYANERALTAGEYMTQPRGGPVIEWLVTAANAWGVSISPEMGFSYNLDTLYHQIPQNQVYVNVTADWGWPAIPDDVQLAVLEVAGDTYSISPYTSESIAGYSRSRGPLGSGAVSERAKDLLAEYQKRYT